MSDVFHFDEDKPNFEAMGIPNGSRTWLQADLQKCLGYDSAKSFDNAIRRALHACISLSFKTEEHFIPYQGAYKLTRLACFLVAMNGDPKKPEVAAAQLYFAALADNIQTQAEHVDGVERVLTRDELTTENKSLAGIARSHGVIDFAFFNNAGYRGMYNMDLSRLKLRKGLPEKHQLMDRMGKEELAANLFRVTQTEAKIKNEGTRGQVALEGAAFSVGRTVRQAMQEISGVSPESLPLAPHIDDVKRTLKDTGKRLQKLDAKPKAKALKSPKK